MLKAATARLAECLSSEPAHSKAKAWLRTLIDDGFPLRQDRDPPAEPSDGGLLTVCMETEIHVTVVHCIARAISSDLTVDTSHWKHSSTGALYNDSVACGFTRSKECRMEYFSWMGSLGNGTPLFGDDFRTEWSFYTVFTNQELAAMLPVLRAAVDFKRPLTEEYPEEVRREIRMELSESAKSFSTDLINWFGQIQKAGQDAFILWW